MSRKRVGVIIWFLGFALSVFLLMVIPNNYSPAIWVTLVFDSVAFISQLFLWLTLFKGKIDAQGTFYRTPAMMVSVIYMVIQFVICIVTGVVGTMLSFKVALIINFVVCILMWILILMLGLAKEHAQRIDSRQKNHHTEL